MEGPTIWVFSLLKCTDALGSRPCRGPRGTIRRFRISFMPTIHCVRHAVWVKGRSSSWLHSPFFAALLLCALGRTFGASRPAYALCISVASLPVSAQPERRLARRDFRVSDNMIRVRPASRSSRPQAGCRLWSSIAKQHQIRLDRSVPWAKLRTRQPAKTGLDPMLLWQASLRWYLRAPCKAGCVANAGSPEYCWFICHMRPVCVVVACVQRGPAQASWRAGSHAQGVWGQIVQTPSALAQLPFLDVSGPSW